MSGPGGNFTYFMGIPNRNNKPSIDQPNMTINNNSNLAMWAVDHTGFNTSDSSGGYHKTIHQTPIPGSFPVTSPNTIQNKLQIYSKPDSSNKLQLFCKNAFSNSASSGQESQLTGYSALTSGYQFLGGVIIQWGFFSGSLAGANTSMGQTITYPLAFPNSLFSITLQPTGNSAMGASPVPANPLVLIVDDVLSIASKTAFTWKSISSATAYTGFYWIAIGN
jgi:hypothetical protein